MRPRSFENVFSSIRKGGPYGLAILLFAFFVIGIPLVDRAVNGKNADARHQELIREFRAITPLPGAVVVNETNSYSRWHSTHQALVGAYYNTLAPWPEIRRHYDNELRSRGWQCLNDKVIYDWGVDNGARETNYCKPPLKASVSFSGHNYEGSEYRSGWTFSLDTSWGLDSADSSCVASVKQ